MDHTLSHLQALGHELPEVPSPVAAYVNCVRSGNLLFLSGGIPPIDEDKTFLGKVPSGCSVELATEAARLITLNRIAVIKNEIGSLDKVRRIVAVNGFVSSEPEFTAQPQVINGCSNLLIEVFGERGKHSRTAVGAPSLPLDVAVEISMIVEVETD